MKNRMLEIGTYGTVRGEGGNILTYSDPYRPLIKWRFLVSSSLRS